MWQGSELAWQKHLVHKPRFCYIWEQHVFRSLIVHSKNQILVQVSFSTCWNVQTKYLLPVRWQNALKEQFENFLVSGRVGSLVHSGNIHVQEIFANLPKFAKISCTQKFAVLQYFFYGIIDQNWLSKWWGFMHWVRHFNFSILCYKKQTSFGGRTLDVPETYSD